MAEKEKGQAAFHAEGRRNRQGIANWLADQLTRSDCPLTVEHMGHYRLINGWFQDGQQALDRIERIYREDRPEIADELHISLIVLCLDKILGDTRPKTVTGAIKRPVKKKPTKSTKKKQAAPVKRLKLASGQAIAFRSVVPKN